MVLLSLSHYSIMTDELTAFDSAGFGWRRAPVGPTTEPALLTRVDGVEPDIALECHAASSASAHAACTSDSCVWPGGNPKPVTDPGDTSDPVSDFVSTYTAFLCLFVVQHQFLILSLYLTQRMLQCIAGTWRALRIHLWFCSYFCLDIIL